MLLNKYACSYLCIKLKLEEVRDHKVVNTYVSYSWITKESISIHIYILDTLDEPIGPRFCMETQMSAGTVKIKNFNQIKMSNFILF